MSTLWCSTCRESTALIEQGICPWCDTPLTRQRPGGNGPPSLVTDEQLRALHVIYTKRGMSAHALAELAYEQLGYTHPVAAAAAFTRGWRRLGLPVRSHREAARLASTTHGLAGRDRVSDGPYLRWRRDQRGWRALHGPGQPVCAGVKTRHPRKGEPCTLPAIAGSEYCLAHDPARRQDRSDRLAAARGAKQATPSLPAGPFSAWLLQLREELGSWQAVADRTQINVSLVGRWAAGKSTGRSRVFERVSVDRARRAAMAAGTTIEAIYGEALR